MSGEPATRESLDCHICSGLAQRIAQRAALSRAVAALDMENQEGRGIGRGGMMRGGKRALARRSGAESLLVSIAHQPRVLIHLRRPEIGRAPGRERGSQYV